MNGTNRTVQIPFFDAIAPAEAEGDFILRHGKFFELGDYPDKQFSLNAEEADAAIAAFEGAPINLEHARTLFDGKLGAVRKLWRSGADLLAEYAIPAWLHRITGGEPIAVSSEWDRETKRPIGAALVLSPRILDAVMMSVEQDLQEEAAKTESTAATAEVCKDIGREKKLSLLGKLATFLRGEGLLESEEIQSAETELAQSAPAASQFSGSSEFRLMSQTLSEQAHTIEQLQAQFAAEQDRLMLDGHLASVQELVSHGKLTAGEAEQWRNVAQAYPAAFTAVLQTLRARPVLPQFTTSPTRKITPSPEEPAGKLVALSRERSAQTGERFDSAFSKICRENPELAAAHAASAPSYRGGSNE